MVRRLLCLSLALSMLANQGLCLTHAHQGTDFAEPEGHALRPHFHVGGHVAHDPTHQHHRYWDHSQGDNSGHLPGAGDRLVCLSQAFASDGEHDSDAVFCADPVILGRDGNLLIVQLTEYIGAAAILHFADQSDRLLRSVLFRGQPPSVFEAACPIYLRTLSLRI